MKKLVLTLTLVVASSMFLVSDGTAAETTANATAEVMTPIAIANTSDLAFGKFSALTGGTVVIATDGTRTATSAVVLSTTNAGGVASFNITGDNNATYAITLPSTAVNITHTDAITTMSVGSFVSDPSGTGLLSAIGAQTLNVGGTLTVGSAQSTGVYSGSFSVSVEYN